MHDDSKFDDFLRQGARDYNAPVPPPADAIWAAIERDVAQAIAPPSRASRTFRAAAWMTLGIAATLLIGVAVGRRTAREPGAQVAAQVVASTPPPTTDSAGTGAHARAVTFEHLEEAEVFLTTVRAELKSGRADTERADRSRNLLVRTRVLLGAVPNRTPEVERLLEDLELLLAEIAALPPDRSSLDRTLLDESMRGGNILPRIRSTLPARMAGA